MLRRGALPAAGIALACLLASPGARAADPADSVKSTEQLADEAYGLQAAGKYAEAVGIYLKVYDLSKAGVTLLNIATIYDHKLHEPELATEYYRRYLTAPDAEPVRVTKVTERLTTLKVEAEQERARRSAAVVPLAPPTPAPAPASAPPTPTPHPPSGAGEPAHGSPVRTLGLVLGGVGIATVGTSLALGYVAKGKNDDANAVCHGAACTSQSGVDLAHSAGVFALASTITFVTGLVFVAGGVTLFAVAPAASSSPSAAHLTLAPRLGPTAAGLDLGGVF